MPKARPVRRSFIGQCLRDLADLVGCGVLWVGLGGLAAVQAWILFTGEYEPPDFVIRRLQAKLTEQGLRADYGRMLVDPTGALLVENLRLYSGESPDPLASSRTLLVRVDPWSLFTGKVNIDDVEGSGLNLYLPAYLSPSGRAEAVLSEGQIRVLFDTPGHLTLDGISGRVAGLKVALDGRLDLAIPRTRAGIVSKPDLAPAYRIGRRLFIVGEQLRPLGELSVRGRLSADRVDLLARADRIDLAKLPPSRLPALTGEARDAILRVSVPFDLTRPPDISADLGGLDLLPPGLPALTADRVLARLQCANLANWDDRSALRIDAFAATLSASPFTLANTSLGLSAEGVSGNPEAALLTRIDGQPWSADITLRDTFADIVVEGRPTAGLVSAADTLVKSAIPLPAILSLGPPPLVRANAQVGLDGTLRAITGHLEGGDAVAYHVPVKEAAADFRWSPGENIVVNDILLRIGTSEARGGYTMDPSSLEFRFLLAGHLNPPDIGGWFHEWWDDFWKDFEFSSPATADVEVRGHWGDPLGTTVFVVAEGERCALKTQPLARLRTTLFIRPGWYDALAFHALDAQGAAADGRFSIATDLEEHRWQRMDFDMDSTLPTEALGRLLGPEAVEIFAPYRFTTPPRIRISGSAAAPSARDLAFDVSTDAPFYFDGFRLDSLHLEGRMRDDVLTLEPMRADFAHGVLAGRAVVSGPDGERWIAIDHRLSGAKLDEVLDILEARDRIAGETETANTGASRRPGGTLDLTLQANGPIARLEKLEGRGHADITGAHFAQISLLGKLSDVLKSTGLGFTSLSLEQLHTDYQLDGRLLTFPNLKLSGASAVVDSSGRYDLDQRRLDFRAKLYPYEGSGNIIGNAADWVLSPLSKFLEFRLTGPMDKPDWSFSYGPRGLLRTLTGSKDTIPPAASTQE